MDAAEYLAGVILVGIVVVGFWASAASLCARLLPGWRGAPAVLGRVVVAISVAIVTCEALGLVGLFTAPALMVTALGLAAGLRLLGPRPASGPKPPAPPVARIGLGLAVAAALLTAIHWGGPVLKSLDIGIYRQDSSWYHMPLAAWLAHTGSVGGLLLTDPLKLTVWYYPLNSELLHAAGMVLLGNDLLSPLFNFGWMGLALLAAWCIGRPFGRGAATLLGGVLVVGSDMMLVQAGNAPSDIVALACLLGAIAMLANGWAARDPSAVGPGQARGFRIDRGPLAIAALAAGLAIGAKVTMLVPVGVITIGILLTARAEIRGRAAIWLGGLFATGGFWYLRNVVHSGNPLPWIQLGPLPGPSQESLYPRPAHSMAEYLADRHAWTGYFFPGFGETLGPLWYAVLFAIFAGIILGLRRRHGAAIRTLALAAAAALLAYVFIPISASGPEGAPYGFTSNLRYAAPGMALGLILLPLLESRRMARQVLAPTYALLVAITAVGSTEWIQPQLATAIAIGAAAVLVPVWLARGSLTWRRGLAVAALVAVVVLAGYPQQRQYFEDRYRADIAPPLDNPGFRATGQWRLIQTWAREQHGMRIGIVGMPAAYGQYVFYGSDGSNEVRYLGEPQPDGGLTPIASCRRWRELVDAGRFDAVVVTPEDPGSPLAPPQLAWTGLDSAAHPVLQVPPAGVFALTGPLDPSRCQRAGAFPGFPFGQRPNPYLSPRGPAGLAPPYFR
jgi:hypothetical protein